MSTTTAVLVIALIWMPILAAGALALYPTLLAALRRLPAHEYEQAQRAPAWFTMALGAGLAVFALLALRGVLATDDQVFIGFPGRDPLWMADAYSLWSCFVLGLTVMLGAWLPGARRSLVPHSTWPFVGVLVLIWLAVLLIFGWQLSVIRICWVLLVLGVMLLWVLLYRPAIALLSLEVPIVLAIAGVCGVIGLTTLLTVAHNGELTGIWHQLLNASPKVTNFAVLFLTFGWLGLAVYLPWWLAIRRDEQAVVWLPAALTLSVVGVLMWPRLLVLAFPAGSPDFLQMTGVERLFLIREMLRWLSAWGMLALIGGVGWFGYLIAQRLRGLAVTLRPLAIVAGGLLLVNGAAAVEGQNGVSLTGLLWTQCAWLGFIGCWLAVEALLPLMTNNETGERTTLTIALVLALLTLLAIPPFPGFQALRMLWPALEAVHASPALILSTLILIGIEVAILIPAVLRQEVAPTRRPGVGWGILAPFGLALLLTITGLLAPVVSPVFEHISASLLQVM